MKNNPNEIIRLIGKNPPSDEQIDKVNEVEKMIMELFNSGIQVSVVTQFELNNPHMPFIMNVDTRWVNMDLSITRH